MNLKPVLYTALYTYDKIQTFDPVKTDYIIKKKKERI